MSPCAVRPMSSRREALLWAAFIAVATATQLAFKWAGTQLENQEFGLIVLRAQFYPTPILQAIGQAYVRAEEVPMNGFRYLILRPK